MKAAIDSVQTSMQQAMYCAGRGDLEEEMLKSESGQ